MVAGYSEYRFVAINFTSIEFAQTIISVRSPYPIGVTKPFQISKIA